MTTDAKSQVPDGVSQGANKSFLSFLYPGEMTGKEHRMTLSRCFGPMRGKLATLRGIVYKEYIQMGAIRGASLTTNKKKKSAGRRSKKVEFEPRVPSPESRVQPFIKHKQRIITR